MVKILHWYRRHKKRHRHAIVFTIGPVSVILNSEERTIVSTSITLGQSLPLSIAELDQFGNPMASFANPDSPPVWAGTPNVVAAADGLTAVYKASAVGTETVGLTVTVAGQVFSASLDVVTNAAAQVLTSVQIVPGTPA